MIVFRARIGVEDITIAITWEEEDVDFACQLVQRTLNRIPLLENWNAVGQDGDPAWEFSETEPSMHLAIYRHTGFCDIYTCYDQDNDTDESLCSFHLTGRDEVRIRRM